MAEALGWEADIDRFTTVDHDDTLTAQAPPAQIGEVGVPGVDVRAESPGLCDVGQTLPPAMIWLVAGPGRAVM
jgi:hypothetical protein